MFRFIFNKIFIGTLSLVVENNWLILILNDEESFICLEICRLNFFFKNDWKEKMDEEKLPLPKLVCNRWNGKRKDLKFKNGVIEVTDCIILDMKKGTKTVFFEIFQ